MSPDRYRFWLVIGTVLLLYVVSFLTIFMRPLEPQPGQWADDQLYFRNAQSMVETLGSRPWLGPFDVVSLSKPLLFPIFLAVINILGIPLRVAEFCLVAPIPFLFVAAVQPVVMSRRGVTLVLASFFLVFIPIAGVDVWLLRTTLFGAAALYCLTALTGFVIRAFSGEATTARWGGLAGLALGLAVTTRADAIWLWVPAGIAIALSAIVAAFNKGVPRFRILTAAALIVVGSLVPVLPLSYLNSSSYGFFASSLRQHSAYREMLSILASLEPQSRQRFVPVHTATRELAYEVSPSFAQLRPFLEGATTDNLARNRTHLAVNGWDPDGREFFFSNFEFALARSIYLAGKDDGRLFTDFCRQVSKELREAIERQKITGGKRGLSTLPSLSLADVPRMLVATGRSFWLLTNAEGLARHQPRHSSNVDEYWHSFLRTWPFPADEEGKHLSETGGWLLGLGMAVQRILCPVLLLLGMFAGGWLWKSKRGSRAVPSLVLMSWCGLGAFCSMMGLLDTLAFGLLRYPGSYNRLGFFPMHFLMLVSAIAIYSCFNRIKVRE